MKCIVFEDQVKAQDMPGRALKWLFTPEMGVAKHLSMNVVSISPGNTVKPAHAHPNLEEVIYITSGEGQVCIDGAVHDIRAGAAVLFQPGVIHMVRNTGEEDLNIVCFFAPAATFADYEMHEEVEFPET